MFEIADASFKIWYLQRKKRRRDAKYIRQISNARKSRKPQAEIQKILDERLQFAEGIDGAVALVETWVLLECAEALRLPTPALIINGPDWVKLTPDGSPVLVDAARAQLRAEIRTEKQALWDRRMRWVGPLTGLMGAVAAVLALLKK